MGRTKIVGSTYGESSAGPRDSWERWLAAGEEDRQFSYLLRGKLRKKFEEQVEKVQRENSDLRAKLYVLADMEKLLKEIGCDSPRGYSHAVNVMKSATRFDHTELGYIGDEVERAKSRLDAILHMIEKKKQALNTTNDKPDSQVAI
jgi:hypothetical protein